MPYVSAEKLYSRTHHMLLSVYGSRWDKVNLVMFTIYLDDSGTSPSQKVAMASALIIPAKSILRFDSEWNKFKNKEGFSDFHTSEFVANNPKSQFFGWSDDKRARVVKRIRQIAKKYGIRAVSIAVNKEDYDQLMPEEFRLLVGRFHYTWAIRQIVSFIHTRIVGPPREYLFDTVGTKVTDESKLEIETVMRQAQWIADKNGVPGDYLNYSFRSRKEIPGLQCVDLIGWVSYQKALFLFRGTPVKEFTEESWLDFGAHLSEQGWLAAFTILRDNLKGLIEREIADGRALESLKLWQKESGIVEKYDANAKSEAAR